MAAAAKRVIYEPLSYWFLPVYHCYYADPKGELEQFADYWGINISHLKELAIDECCKKFDVSTVETARASLKQMQIYMDKYHFYGDFPTKTRAKKVLKAYHDRFVP